MAKDKVWVMLANVCDQSLQRNHVALELARSLSGVDFLRPLYQSSILNGEYRGFILSPKRSAIPAPAFLLTLQTMKQIPISDIL